MADSGEHRCSPESATLIWTQNSVADPGEHRCSPESATLKMHQNSVADPGEQGCKSYLIRDRYDIAFDIHGNLTKVKNIVKNISVHF